MPGIVRAGRIVSGRLGLRAPLETCGNRLMISGGVGVYPKKTESSYRYGTSIGRAHRSSSRQPIT
jgi:hypothetical protein